MRDTEISMEIYETNVNQAVHTGNVGTGIKDQCHA